MDAPAKLHTLKRTCFADIARDGQTEGITMRVLRLCLLSVWCVAALPGLVLAADRAKLQDFLEVTGFDVALESIRLTASSAPQILGMQAETFGTEWTRLTEEVFATETMHDMALDILEQTLDDEMLTHAADFYATDLGQRLVVAENASHLTEDDSVKLESGADIVAALEGIDSPRLDYIRRMNAASDSAGTAVRAILEVQVRFIMAAAGAGVIELQRDEEGLRELFKADEEAMTAEIAAGALTGAAYTYQSFSDAEVLTYAEALEHPRMRHVYDLMNAVQYEIMANRFEALAVAMQRLQPSQEL
ncbi:DUF2059 domain-containing protein [uncultured Tateyamaria sp.]|uniref:DUF2059 domain-containing protein n=1 Tax=uncultured Tateyamaria sp. TaxID=455651 RepID=UPI0026337D2C|nr:DUF2059 domain-containing protein [uncultured Tateyamaria sp.]